MPFNNILLPRVLLVVQCLLISAPASALSLGEKLSGRILLQVEDKGKGWYVESKTQERAYLGRPSDAFRIMWELSSGITNADIDRILVNEQYADPEQPATPIQDKESTGVDENQVTPQKKSKEEVNKIAPVEIKKVEPIKLDIKVKSPSQVTIPPIQSPKLRADPLLRYYDSLSPF